MPCLFGTVSCNDCVEHVYGHSALDEADIYLLYPPEKQQILCHRANNQIKIDFINYPKIPKHATDGFLLTFARDHPTCQQQPSGRISNSRIPIKQLLFADGAIDVDYLHELSVQSEWNMQRLSAVKDQ